MKVKYKALKEDFGVEGMNTPNIRGLINHYAKNAKCYVEIGSYQGSTLCAAAYKNPKAKIIGIDNFSWGDKRGRNEGILKQAIKGFDNVEFLNTDCIDGINKLIERGEKVDVFFYDGDHTTESTFNALFAINQILADDAVIIVDDINWEYVQKAVNDFKSIVECKTLFEQFTDENGSSDWWNGITVIQKIKDEEVI